ncbi:g11793 [Coccomyxa viridis]|uniref:G11793 protein n=1 Tax=Coccomyxa viridis TaxID=1274662 RepID=A0ABP1G946_9CHLO
MLATKPPPQRTSQPPERPSVKQGSEVESKQTPAKVDTPDPVKRIFQGMADVPVVCLGPEEVCRSRTMHLVLSWPP